MRIAIHSARALFECESLLDFGRRVHTVRDRVVSADLKRRAAGL